MPSEMDRSLKRHLDGHLAPGALLELTEIERFGTPLPAFRNAPPTLGAFFAYYCGRYGDQPFLVDGDIRLTFAETLAAARVLAGGLIETHGVQKGDRVGIAARNSANWIVAYMAVLLSGGCATLLNGFSTGQELSEAIALAGCRLVLADPQRAARLEGLEHGSSLVVFSHGMAPAEDLPRSAQTAEGPRPRCPKSGLTIWPRSCSPPAPPASRKARCRIIAAWCRPHSISRRRR